MEITKKKFYSKPFTFLCYWLIAAVGGVMFGYDIGITGGVTSMDEFLIKFFPHIYTEKQVSVQNNYCQFDDQNVQFFTSSLYIAALISGFIASKICSKFGCKWTMLVAATLYLIGVVLTGAATNIVMLIIGRVSLGAGVGFGNESIPSFLSEIAPVKYSRGAVYIHFQLFVTVGILVASIVYYLTTSWRLALSLAGVPAGMLFVGSLIIPETPISLVERGRVQKARTVLEKIRRTEQVDDEYNGMIIATIIAEEIKNPYKRLMQPSSRPALVIGVLMQVFTQITGISAILYYAPILFETLSFNKHDALFWAVITGLVNVVSTLFAEKIVDLFGRRVLLLSASCVMLVSQVSLGTILQLNLSATGTLCPAESVCVVVLVNFYVMSSAWSWEPLGWLIPSETFPIETRDTGLAVADSFNTLCNFIIAQVFLSMMCHMQASLFFFFAGWILFMGVFVWFFVPETKNVHIEDMVEKVWKVHWFWKKYMDCDVDENGKAIFTLTPP